MKLFEIIRMICVNLVQNKYKVFLTSLGIIIGTATITLVIAIGQGGEQQIANQFKNMSAETIYINYRPPFSRDLDSEVEKLNEENLKIIKEENPYISDIYFRTLFSADVIFPKEKSNILLTSISDGYSDVSNYTISTGENFSESDFEEGSRFVILGEQVATQYFGSSESALNQTISIKGMLYNIIGILDATNDSLQGVSPDQSIFIPNRTAINDKLIDDSFTPQGVALATDKNLIPKAVARLESSINYVFDDSEVYVVEDAGSRIDAAMESATTMKILLVSVATIVFIVSGIGIMNVLFVTVKERTREIGVLKAIGTTQKDILYLFLFEAIGIGIFGGIIGIILSSFALMLMKTSSIPIYPTISGKIIAFIFAVVTATIFGFYPAFKASQLKPIDALNIE